jgi:hypothetical protein
MLVCGIGGVERRRHRVNGIGIGRERGGDGGGEVSVIVSRLIKQGAEIGGKVDGDSKKEGESRMMEGDKWRSGET